MSTQFQDYIPREAFTGSAREWLRQEYARQERLGVRTFQRMHFIPDPHDMTKDRMIPLEAFEHTKKV